MTPLRFAAAGALLACLWAGPGGAEPALDAPRPVGRDAIREAMAQSVGYDLTATTNAARLQAEVLLRLARAARARDAAGPPLLVGHEEWFAAFLEATGLPLERAPLFARLARSHRQDCEVDYRQDHVVKAVEQGPPPRLALNVLLSWPLAPGSPEEYSYEDLLAEPRLKVTNKRVVSYRLLDYGDQVRFEEVEGVTGRPLTGMLAVLFKVLGEGRVVEYRMAVAPDGLQVSRGRAEKAFLHVTTTVTVHPDGRTDKDVPPHRPDLQAIEARLKEARKVSYWPLRR